MLYDVERDLLAIATPPESDDPVKWDPVILSP